MISATKAKLIAKFKWEIVLTVTMCICLVIVYVRGVYFPHLQNIVKGEATKNNFSLLGSVGQSMKTEGWVFLVKGDFEGEKIAGYVPVANFECPVSIEFRSIKSLLSYEIDESDMKKYSKERSDKCVSYYAQLIVEKFSPDIANHDSYKGQ